MLSGLKKASRRLGHPGQKDVVSRFEMGYVCDCVKGLSLESAGGLRGRFQRLFTGQWQAKLISVTGQLSRFSVQGILLIRPVISELKGSLVPRPSSHLLNMMDDQSDKGGKEPLLRFTHVQAVLVLRPPSGHSLLHAKGFAQYLARSKYSENVSYCCFYQPDVLTIGFCSFI